MKCPNPSCVRGRVIARDALERLEANPKGLVEDEECPTCGGTGLLPEIPGQESLPL